MLFSKTTFIGIDPSGGRHPFTYAALDEECQLVALASGETEDVLAFLGGQQATVVAVNAPRMPESRVGSEENGRTKPIFRSPAGG